MPCSTAARRLLELPPAMAKPPTSTRDLALFPKCLTRTNLSHLRGHLGIGHTRYSTTGSRGWATRSPTFWRRLMVPSPLATTVIGQRAPIAPPTPGAGCGPLNIDRQRTDNPPAGRRARHLAATNPPGDDNSRRRLLLTILTREAVYGVRDPGVCVRSCWANWKTDWPWLRRAAPLPPLAPVQFGN